MVNYGYKKIINLEQNGIHMERILYYLPKQLRCYNVV